jgi:hypothetical protein
MWLPIDVQADMHGADLDLDPPASSRASVDSATSPLSSLGRSCSMSMAPGCAPRPRHTRHRVWCLRIVMSTHGADVVPCLRRLHPHCLHPHCLMMMRLTVVIALVGLVGKIMMISCLRLHLLLNLGHAYRKVYDSQNNILMVLFDMVCFPPQLNPALLLKHLRIHVGVRQCKMNTMH